MRFFLAQEPHCSRFFTIHKVEQQNGENPTWLVAQRTISEDGFIDRLRNLDASSVSEETLHRLQRVTHHPRFTPETLVEDEKYFPFAPLCDWVLEAVTSADEHFREKWAAIGLEAPTGEKWKLGLVGYGS